MNGYILLHKRIMDWEWWDDHNTTRLFIFMLLSANHKDGVWQGNPLKRGQFISSLEKMSRATGLSIQSIRTSLNKLKISKEITCKSTRYFTEVTVCKYNEYQPELKPDQHTRQQKINTPSNNGLTTTNENNENNEIPPLPPRGENSQPKSKKSKSKKSSPASVGVGPPDYVEFQKYAVEQEPRINQKSLRAKYDAWVDNGWKDGFDKPIKNWKSKIRNTLPHLPKTDSVQEYRSGYKYDHTRLKDGETYLDRFRRNKIDPRDTKEVEIFVDEEGIMLSSVQAIQSHWKNTPEKFPYVKD